MKASNTPLFRDVFTSTYPCGDVRYKEKEILIQDPDGSLLRFLQTQKIKRNEAKKDF